MSAIAQNPQIGTVSSTEALWSLIVSQKKSVQKTLAARLSALLTDEKKHAQEAYVRESLSHAYNEARQAYASGLQLPDARNLFDDIED